MENKQLKLDGVIIPYITNDKGIDYYPIRYVLEQFLMKASSSLHTKESLKQFVEKYEVDYTFKGTVPQETYCMNRKGWIKYFSIGKKNKNKTDEKINRLRIFYDYLGIEYVCECKYEYSSYAIACIKEQTKNNPNIKFKRCSRCERKFPIDHHFFNKDNRLKCGLLNICRECNSGNFLTDNKQYQYIFTNYGIDKFKEYISNPIEFYKECAISKTGNRIIFKYVDNKIEFMLKVIKRLYESNYINNDDLGLEFIKDNFNFDFRGMSELKSSEIIKTCSNGECEIRPWLYKKYTIGKIDYKKGVELFRRYIKENNIVIEDKFNYKGWSKLIAKARLSHFSDRVLNFIVELYDREYGGYMFHISSSNYYKDKDNMVLDMKYLIEKDFDIPIEKTPLYVTKYTLKQKSNSLYRLIKHNNHFKDLFEWIDYCYPNMFIRSDFDLNPYRSKFDSLEEAQVDEELRKRFTGVIYNPRDSDDTVKINGMIPDWIIISEKGCILTEYYGMYQEKYLETSHRLRRYKNKMDKKLIKYDKLETSGYTHLAIYPDDIRGSFGGLHKKIDNLFNE